MDELKQRRGAMWGAGDYAAVAERIGAVGALVVERSGVAPGMEVLDAACGTGNATIPAARRGARVTGLDLSVDLLAIARERAADAMVEVNWVEGDVQAMPFEAGSFDRVVSTFGHMFAPDHRRTAAELRRVCRPGGAIAMCCWTPDGAIGRMSKAVADLVPPPPDSQSPLLWGTEQHVRELLGKAEFERHEVEWRDESVASYADFMLESYGPLISARETLAARSPALREAYVGYLERENTADDGRLRFRGEYLLAVVRL
jgi:ubiquinone/menaquinone biosynthesis C-methylase UbiE